jgi:hypothetical protein
VGGGGSSCCGLTDRGSAAARRELPEYRAAADRASNPGPGGGRATAWHAPDAGGQLQPLVRQPPFRPRTPAYARLEDVPLTPG